jgi:pyruvate kinase
MDEEHEQPRLAALAASLSEILEEALRLEGECLELVGKVPATHRPSAVNLLHYLALRRHDLRASQWELHTLGLSSLGRSEAYVLRSLEVVLAVIRRLQGLSPADTLRGPSRPDFATGRRLLKDHTAELLGPPPAGRRVRIMVTMPIEVAERHDLVRPCSGSALLSKKTVFRRRITQLHLRVLPAGRHRSRELDHRRLSI